MKVAISGANGFVGRYVVQRLIERGDQVVAVVRNQACNQVRFDRRVTCYRSDFSRSDLRNAFQKADAVIHLAAARPTLQINARGFLPYFEANVQVMENVILAACDNDVGTFCQASSIAVYSPGENQIPYTETECPVPLSLYGVSKTVCENLAAIYACRNPVRVISLRLAQIFGWGEREDMLVIKFVNQARQKQVLKITGYGACARDYLYVKDVVSALECALDQKTASGIFNVGSGRMTSVREVAETVNEVFDNTGNIFFETDKEESQDSFYMERCLAASRLGWAPCWSLRSGLQDMKRLMEGY